MTTDTSAPLADGTRIGALWAANLLGPVAALAGLEIAYILADRACVTGDLLPVHLTWLAGLLAAGVGGWLGHREWRRWGAGHAGEAISLVSREERPLLTAIEHLLQRRLARLPLAGFSDIAHESAASAAARS